MSQGNVRVSNTRWLYLLNKISFKIYRHVCQLWLKAMQTVVISPLTDVVVVILKAMLFISANCSEVSIPSE